MLRIRLFAWFVCVLAVVGLKAEDFPQQTFSYDIYWHCSFINELAASANIQVSDYGGRYSAILGGKTKDIGGRMYCVNDTVQTSFEPSGQTIKPASERVEYMAAYYRKPHIDDVTDIYSPKNYKNINGGGYLSADDATMECVHLTADMLCWFYYAKSVDFSQMEQGVPIDVPVFMPDGHERTLQMIYQGTSDYNGRTVYDIMANFTYDGQLSSYPIKVLIDSEWRIPVEFSASIAIGQVRMAYVQ